MNTSIHKYLKVFKKLRIDRSHGIAPHKPILLISIIQEFRNGQITENKIYLTPELVAQFKTNWGFLVNTNHDCRISYPFFHMKSEGFWTLKPKSGFSSLDKMGSLVKSFSNLNAAVEYAELATDLFYLLNEEDSNQALLQFLLKEYFPETNSYFQGNDSTNLFSDLESDFFNEPPGDYKSKTRALVLQKEDEELFLRGSIFKREIPRIYKNSCCITGLRIESVFNISMIDACHIVPFSIGYDDTVTNGIALCPNLHRAFDRGLMTITPDYKVRLSDSFIEEGKYSLKQFVNKKISLPTNQSYWPNRENLEWHMKETFRI